MEKHFEFEESSQKKEEEKETLSNREKFEVVLGLFGTDDARDAFIENCKKYAKARRDSLMNTYVKAHGENYVSMDARYKSSPQRAYFHNWIMDALNRLSLQRLDPLQKKVLNEMRNSRETAGQIIEDWTFTQEGIADKGEFGE